MNNVKTPLCSCRSGIRKHGRCDDEEDERQTPSGERPFSPRRRRNYSVQPRSVAKTTRRVLYTVRKTIRTTPALLTALQPSNYPSMFGEKQTSRSTSLTRKHRTQTLDLPRLEPRTLREFSGTTVDPSSSLPCVGLRQERRQAPVREASCGADFSFVLGRGYRQRMPDKVGREHATRQASRIFLFAS